MKRLRIPLTFATVLLVTLLAASPAAAQCDPDGREGQLSDVFTGTTALEWRMLAEHTSVTLTVSAPCGLHVERTFEKGENPIFDLKEIPAEDPDGRYHWQLRIDPPVDSGLAKQLREAHESGADGRLLEYQLKQKGLLPAGPFRESGSFLVFRGAIVPPDLEEEGAGGKSTVGVRPAATSAEHCPVGPESEAVRLSRIVPAVDRGGSTRPMAAAEGQRRSVGADQVIPDDLIVQGSACVGFDCVNGEAFSFDTIRLKENNLRIKFDDTSTVAGFPNTDWQLTANDSASGGAGKFSIEDISGARVPFTVRAGASTNSIFVDSTGRVGFRTSTPVLDLHVSTSNTPGIRLEQTSAGGFSAQTWDIAGNEANFFIRDVTGGSRLPFRIRPGASTSTVTLLEDGLIGFNTFSSTAAAALRTEDGNLLIVDGDLTVREDDDGNSAAVLSASATRGTLELQASGSTTTALNLPGGTSYVEGNLGIAGCQAPDHDLVLGGTGAGCNTGTFSEIDAGEAQFTVSSSRAIKKNLEPVVVEGILEKIAGIDVYTYDFIDGKSDRIGLMAEDFHEIFRRGSAGMLSGHDVQLALWLAVQELTARNEELRREVEQLKASH